MRKSGRRVGELFSKVELGGPRLPPANETAWARRARPMARRRTRDRGVPGVYVGTCTADAELRAPRLTERRGGSSE